MRSAGELLKEKRITLELTIEDIAKKTKIKEEYIRAIENSAFNELPSATFTKGLLRSYAKSVHLNADTIVAMFRRDFTENKEGEIIPRGLVAPVTHKPKFLTVNILLLIIGILVFVSFMSWQLIAWSSLPKLKVLQPIEGETYGDKLTVRGVAEKDSKVMVNEQAVILNSAGEFSLDLVFPAGTHALHVSATNREGKSRAIERTFTIVK